MRILRDYQSVPENARGAVVALGNFDGVHLGHRVILAEARTRAQQLGAPASVMTFEPHPRQFFSPSQAPIRLAPFHVKARLLSEADDLFVMRFNRAFSQLSAQEFVEQVLVRGLGVRHVVTGEDFAFGSQRSGDSTYLAVQAEKFGFGYSAISPQAGDGGVYSSSAVRRALTSGDVVRAGEILGRPYELTGRVRTGDRRGRDLGFPTANLVPSGVMLPAFGVYAARFCVAPPGWRADSPARWVSAVANLGQRPTFGGNKTRLEVHGLDWQEDVYGLRLRVQLLQRLRGEQRFDGPEALKAQIALDCQKAREILAA